MDSLENGCKKYIAVEHGKIIFTDSQRRGYVVASVKERIVLEQVKTALEELLKNKSLIETIKLINKKWDCTTKQMKKTIEELKKIKVYLEEGGYLRGNCFVEKEVGL